MSECCYYLDHYPLKEHYDVCREYLYGKTDWQSKSTELKEKGVIWFDISNAINLFPHLELDEDYALICYLSSEYHGLWGHVAALHHSASRTPIIDSEFERLSKLIWGTHFKLPEAAVPPMEAIYNDGTSEGYLEALLCDLFLSAFPYTRHEQEHLDIIMTEPPFMLGNAWDSYVDIPDWRPRAIVKSGHADTIIAFRREIENGIGASSGQDRIYLSQYNFQSWLGLYHSLLPQKSRAKYQGQIDDDARYTDKRRCCVSVVSSLLIAQEKHYTVKD